AAVNHHSAGSGQLHPVAVTPYIVIFGKVCSVVFAAIRVIPEADGHTGEGSSADQLALLTDGQAVAIAVKHLDLHAQSTRLQLTAINGGKRVAKCETGDDVGPAGDARQAEFRLDV